MSSDASTTPAETTTQQPAHPESAPQQEAAQEQHTPPVEVPVAAEFGMRRVAELREAAKEADAAAKRLAGVAGDAREAQPSALRTVATAALWTVTAFAVGWGLNKLAEWASAAQDNRQRFPRGTEEAQVEAGPRPATQDASA
jgi:hypothetical protein